MVRTKVFVGNLSFKVTDAELSALFAPAGSVVSANIITRGPRSLGYGFVEMQSDEEAQKAVDLLNKKDVDGRQINVEVAKVREDGEQAPEKRPPAPKKRRTRRPRVQKEGGEEKGEGETKTEGEAKGEGAKAEGAAPRKRAPRVRKPKAEKAEKVEGETPKTEGEKEPKAPRVRKARAPRPQTDEERTPSKSTLFVANLPFSLDDEGFGAVLKGLNLPFKQAHVVKKHNNRSKGYGFIEFSTEEDQLKALDALNKKSVEERELSVKIALTEYKVPEAEKSEGKEETKAEKKAADK